ncbi:meckelin-like [Hyalella azteca]|uniref:Meckelin-like n=1 Tax=Hyalella azteca TaxID=294128 RepID=A0A8B7PG68_HYAAZ|nr:meckelin-like [Hyalella azteca]
MEVFLVFGWQFLLFFYSSFNEVTCSFVDLCPGNEFFDPISLLCKQCPANQSFVVYSKRSCSISGETFLSPWGHGNCQCSPGFFLQVQKQGMACQECPENFTASTDGRACVKCQSDDLYDEELKVCKPCPQGFISIDRAMNGTQFSRKMCIKCEEGTLADSSINRCLACPASFFSINGRCECPEATHSITDGQCVKLSELMSIPDRESSYLIPFNSMKVKSEILHKYYRSVAHGCVFKSNLTSCQFLANMCVLLHYAFDNELNACGYYRTVFGKSVAGLPAHVPGIYYDENDAPQLLTDTKMNTVFSFQPSSPNNVLNFTVLKVSPYGQILGIGEARQLLELCPKLKYHLGSAFQFGISFKLSCLIPTFALWNNYETLFYELYLNYYNEETQLFERYPLYILNTEFEKDKVLVNRRARLDWQLTKRFFLFDNLGGREAVSAGTSRNALAVRYAKYLKLIITKRKDGSDGLIYPPLLVLTYDEVPISSLRAADDVEMTLEVQYNMDFSDAKRDVSISAGVMSIFAVLWSLIEAYSWGKRSGKVGVDLSGIFRLLLISCGNLANVFFLVMFSACLYWTIIFKHQGVVFLLLPTPQDEYLIKQYLISAFSLKLVHLCYVFYGQMTLDLFLIDWEKPRAQNTIPHPRLSKKSELTGNSSGQTISIWRIYFIANEWNEIQSLRKINLAYHLIAILFFLKVLGVENHASFNPNSSMTERPAEYEQLDSFVCRFSLSVSLHLLLIALQLLVRSAIYERYIENKLQQFIDLCSMANISVFILENPLYGYYIHGRSVHGFADSDLLTFYEQLKREEEDLCAYRGLEASSDCQTFEVITTYRFREEYLRILTPTLQQNATSLPQFSSNHRLKLDTKKVELTVQAHETMKNFFEMFLQHSSPEVDFVIKDKLFLETVLDVEFQTVDDKCLFFRDQKHLFDRVLLYGQETVLVLFEILLFTFVDLLSYDFVLSAVVTYAVSSALKALRNVGGKRNLIKKTLVDQRFLI